MNNNEHTQMISFDTIMCQYMVDHKENYYIKIEKTPYFIIRAPIEYFTPAAQFNHPNIAGSKISVFEYKHSRKDGSKFWTSALGIELYFIIPACHISLIPNKGYSYVDVMINNEKFVLNVSGGTSGNGWTDYVNKECSICGTKKWTKAKLNKLAEVALSPSECELRGISLSIKDYEESDLKSLANEYFKHTVTLLNGMEFYYDGDKEGCCVGKEGQGYTFKNKENPWNLWKVSAKRINWLKTAKAHGALPFEPKIINNLKSEVNNVVNS